MKTLKDITSEEKISIFDELFQSALDHFNSQIDPKLFREDSDDSHYLYEDVMIKCLGNDVFRKMHELQKQAGIE